MEDLESAELLVDLPPRESTTRGHGGRSRAQPAPCTLVDMYVETVLDAEHRATHWTPTPSHVAQVMHELYDRGVQGTPVQARHLALCPSCPSGPVQVAGMLQALNGARPSSIVDDDTLRIARAREATISKRPEGWGSEGPCTTVASAHYAAYLLLRSAGFPARALPKPTRVASVSTAFRRISLALKW